MTCPEIRKLVVISGTTEHFIFGLRELFRKKYKFEVFRKSQMEYNYPQEHHLVYRNAKHFTMHCKPDPHQGTV